MKKSTLFLLLLITVSCSVDPFAVDPADIARSQGSDLLEFVAAYTTLGYDGTSRTTHRLVSHRFDKACRLTERREAYTEDKFTYSVERLVYSYNNEGLLTLRKHYESYNGQPERLTGQITCAYDAQGRLIRQNTSGNGTNWKFEYFDDKNQVNRYACTSSGDNCILSTITDDGKRTYPEGADYANGYVSSSPTPYGNVLFETIDAKGNEVLTEVYDGYEKKTLLDRIVQTYDAQPAIPLAVDEADFNGYPADDQRLSDNRGNNLVRSDHYTYDPATGAVRKHLRSICQYSYNNVGFPNRVKTEETDMLTGKPTGVRSVMTIRYGCGN